MSSEKVHGSRITREQAMEEGWFIPNDDGLCQCGCGGRVAKVTYTNRARGIVGGEFRRFLPNHMNTSLAALEAPEGTKHCGGCHQTKLLSEFHNNKKSPRGVAAQCKLCVKQRDKMRNQKRKRIVVEAYGGECACCGESELAFLCIDHVLNDGGIQRRDHFKRTGTLFLGHTFYRWLINNGFPANLQVLCFNCNFAKQFGPCPHKMKVDNYA